jgi:hypothetical protein
MLFLQIFTWMASCTLTYLFYLTSRISVIFGNVNCSSCLEEGDKQVEFSQFDCWKMSNCKPTSKSTLDIIVEDMKDSTKSVFHPKIKMVSVTVIHGSYMFFFTHIWRCEYLPTH